MEPPQTTRLPQYSRLIYKSRLWIIDETVQRWASVSVSRTSVALITPSFEGGGVKRVMLNSANGLAARDISVDLVAISAHGPYRDQVAKGVQIVMEVERWQTRSL